MSVPSDMAVSLPLAMMVVIAMIHMFRLIVGMRPTIVIMVSCGSNSKCRA